ncbi:hypothetical protein CR513_57294, partial [Mucuna pruriens]
MNYNIHECQIPLNILRNRFVDSFLTSLLASEETSASASTTTMPESASAAISRTSNDFALRNLTNSDINPASPIAFLASSDVPHNLNATFNANS